jgi:hypothetical protein
MAVYVKKSNVDIILQFLLSQLQLFKQLLLCFSLLSLQILIPLCNKETSLIKPRLNVIKLFKGKTL